jgi:hypothetical protein
VRLTTGPEACKCLKILFGPVGRKLFDNTFNCVDGSGLLELLNVISCLYAKSFKVRYTRLCKFHGSEGAEVHGFSTRLGSATKEGTKDTWVCIHVHKVLSSSLGLNLHFIRKMFIRDKGRNNLFQLCHPDRLSVWCHLNKPHIFEVPIEAFKGLGEQILGSIIYTKSRGSRRHHGRKKNEGNEGLVGMFHGW